MKYLRFVLLWISISTLTFTNACGSRQIATPTREPSLVPAELEIPFETLDRKEYPIASEKFSSLDPALLVVAQPEDLPTISKWVSPEVKDELEKMDYQSNFALAVFQGRKATTEFAVQVERIVRRGNSVTLFATFQEPRPDRPKGAMETSPYHIVKAKKQGNWRVNVTFELNVNGNVALTVSHYIP